MRQYFIVVSFAQELLYVNRKQVKMNKYKDMMATVQQNRLRHAAAWEEFTRRVASLECVCGLVAMLGLDECPVHVSMYGLRVI